MTTFRRLGSSELLPRYIFAEALFARRRVLEVGAVASTLGQSARFLATRGARIVVACDEDVAAVEEAKRRFQEPNLRFRPPVFDDLEPGSFDLVIVADLAAYVRAPELLAELVRLVSPGGYLMGGLRNPAGLALSQVMEPEGGDAPPTYGQLLDALSPHFKFIEVATQSPVLGYQLAFEKGERILADGSLVGSSEAAYYVVLAGNEPVRNFDGTWVQLPPEPLAFSSGRLEEYSQRARAWEERSSRLKEALQRTQDELAQKEQRLLQTSEQLEEAREAVVRLTAQLESLSGRPELDRERDELAVKLKRLESELFIHRDRALDAEKRVALLKGELEVATRAQKEANVQALAAQEQARLERARREELFSQLEDARERLARAYEDAKGLESELAGAHVELERARLSLDRATESRRDAERAAEQARAREIELAEKYARAVEATDGLKNQLQAAESRIAELEKRLSLKDAEVQMALRSAQADAAAVKRLEGALAAERKRNEELQNELERLLAEKAGVDTELAALRGNTERIEAELETVRRAERATRELAAELEQKLAVAKMERDEAIARLSQMEVAFGQARREAAERIEEIAALKAHLDETKVDRQDLADGDSRPAPMGFDAPPATFLVPAMSRPAAEPQPPSPAPAEKPELDVADVGGPLVVMNEDENPDIEPIEPGKKK